MSKSSRYNGFDRDNLLLDEDTWPAFFGDALEDDPDAAESLTRILFVILEAIDSGPKEIERLENTLWNGIEWGYQHTRAHRSALKLYLTYLEGKLLVEDEPMSLITRAMKHSADARERTRESRKSRKAKAKEEQSSSDFNT